MNKDIEVIQGPGRRAEAALNRKVIEGWVWGDQGVWFASSGRVQCVPIKMCFWFDVVH